MISRIPLLEQLANFAGEFSSPNGDALVIQRVGYGFFLRVTTGDKVSFAALAEASGIFALVGLPNALFFPLSFHREEARFGDLSFAARCKEAPLFLLSISGASQHDVTITCEVDTKQATVFHGSRTDVPHMPNV